MAITVYVRIASFSIMTKLCFQSSKTQSMNWECSDKQKFKNENEVFISIIIQLHLQTACCIFK